jgi:hypothetical protein
MQPLFGRASKYSGFIIFFHSNFLSVSFPVIAFCRARLNSHLKAILRPQRLTFGSIRIATKYVQDVLNGSSAWD